MKGDCNGTATVRRGEVPGDLRVSEMILKGKAVTLREHSPKISTPFNEWHGDRKVMVFLSWGAETLEESSLYLADCIRDRKKDPRDKYRLAIVGNETGRVMGSATLHWRGRGANGGDGRLGCFLARDYQGRGYAREATRLLMEFGIDTLGMHRLSATCLAGNEASERTLKSLGFVYEGTMRRHSCRDGVWIDRHFYSVLSHE